MDFLEYRSIQVRIGSEVSNIYWIENGTPQGSVINPLLFSVTVNDVFEQVEPGIGRSLFADDGALWKRGKDTIYNTKNIQKQLV